MSIVRMPRVTMLAHTLLAVSRPGMMQTRGISEAAAAVMKVRNINSVIDSIVSYADIGEGDHTMVFLHGNPTSRFLWRNIIPHVQPMARCLAPDLIGMGQSGKQPMNKYLFKTQYKYLSAWLKSVDLPEKVTFVGHDWGVPLAFHWANEHRDRIHSLIFSEGFVKPIPSWDDFPAAGRKMFQSLRTEAGEELCLKKNIFIERMLPGSMMRRLTKEEMDTYRKPYKEAGESRRPTLTWAREIPVGEEGPQDVADIINASYEWLSEDASIPKLYIHGNPGYFSPLVKGAVDNWPNLQIAHVDGLHFLMEDSPQEIGMAIVEFLTGLKEKDQSEQS